MHGILKQFFSGSASPASPILRRIGDGSLEAGGLGNDPATSQRGRDDCNIDGEVTDLKKFFTNYFYR